MFYVVFYFYRKREKGFAIKILKNKNLEYFAYTGITE